MVERVEREGVNGEVGIFTTEGTEAAFAGTEGDWEGETKREFNR